MSSTCSSSANSKGTSKSSKDQNSKPQFAAAYTAYERGATGTTHTGGSGGVETTSTAAGVHVKQEGGVPGQSSKRALVSMAGTTPHSGSPGHQTMGSNGVGGIDGRSLANHKTMGERPTTDHSGTNSNSHGNCAVGVPDTPLTHFRAERGKPTTPPALIISSSSSSSSSSTLSGQRAPCGSGGGGSGANGSNGNCHHPLLASSTMAAGSAVKSEGQSSSSAGQQALSSAQTGTGSSGKNSLVNVHARTKGPVTRSTTAASSLSTCGDALPMVSGSPSEKSAKSAEKPHGAGGGGGGLSSEEARKLRQAQQKLQKEQWMKKYGHGTKRTLEMQQSGGAGGSGEDGGRQLPQANLDTGAEQPMENGVLISDGKLYMW